MCVIFYDVYSPRKKKLEQDNKVAVILHAAHIQYKQQQQKNRSRYKAVTRKCCKKSASDNISSKLRLCYTMRIYAAVFTSKKKKKADTVYRLVMINSHCHFLF